MAMIPIPCFIFICFLGPVYMSESIACIQTFSLLLIGKIGAHRMLFYDVGIPILGTDSNWRR